MSAHIVMELSHIEKKQIKTTCGEEIKYIWDICAIVSFFPFIPHDNIYGHLITMIQMIESHEY